jgi:hypothetical protein
MYSTCLFCHSSLGRNESIEHFPVGRRLAFDAAKGRLWVVCRKCERWNLSPLEERWEAIEESERTFRETRLRVSTDHIGLARLREGLELIRIGEPQRPEMAAWRYGDQFGRRRRRQIGIVAGGAAVVVGIAVAGPMIGIAGGSVFNIVFNAMNAGRGIYGATKLIHLPSSESTDLRTRLGDLRSVALFSEGSDIALQVPIVARGVRGAFWFNVPREKVTLIGDDAIRAAGALLPYFNRGGGSARDVASAVDYLEESSDPGVLFRRAAKAIEARNSGRVMWTNNRNSLRSLPTAGRLALEMAAHEDTERRALEGELHILEEAWKDAEEIAAISDDLLLPDSVHSDLARLKRGPAA